MSMTADSSSQNHQSPRSGVDGINSPQKRKNLPSAWAQVVRGEPESIPNVHQIPSPPPSTSPTSVVTPVSTPELSTFSDCSLRKAACSPKPPPPAEIYVAATDSSEGYNDNAGRPEKPAWKKPSNGVAEVSPVMGAVSWPALSESTKFSPKSSVADSSAKNVVSDGSLPSPQGPVISHSPHKQASSNAKSNSTSSHAPPTRQRSMKRGDGGGGSGGGHSQNSFSHPPPPPPPLFTIFALPPNGYGNMVPTMPDQSPREPPYRGNNWEPRPVGGFVPQPPAVNANRHSPRRGNFGTRGDGPYNNNFGGRHDQDRGHYGNARDVPVQSQRSPRGFVRPPPPNTATFVPPQSVRPFANHMGYPDLVYIPTLPLESFRGMAFITHSPPAMIVPQTPLPVKLVHQIEYYFSDANLIKDEYLKSNMDDQGWVPITLIAGFNRVKNMTLDIQLILDSLRTSTVLDVQDDKVRRRNDWLKWIPSSGRLPADSGLQASSASSHDMLTNSFQKMIVGEATANQNSMTIKSSPNLEDAPANSSEVMAHLQSSQGEGIEDASLS